MSEKEVTFFLILRGLYFLTFFDTSKTEGAKTFLSFSNKPDAKQDDMGGHVVAISCSKMISIFCHMTLSSSKRMWADKPWSASLNCWQCWYQSAVQCSSNRCSIYVYSFNTVLSIVCAPQISCGKTDVAMPNTKIDYCRQTPNPLIIKINCQG